MYLSNTFWLFTWAFTSCASQFAYPDKYLDKYPESIYLKVFTYSLLPNLQNHVIILTKIGNNPVGKKV